MKVAQLKTTVAVGLAATVVIGLTTYTVAKGIAPIAKGSPKSSARVLTTLPVTAKPGHLLAQTPGKALTAVQIVAKCRAAYGALQSYQGTTTGIMQGMKGPAGSLSEYHTSASIQFVRPDKIRVEGMDMEGRPYVYVADGPTALDKNGLTKGVWQKGQSLDVSIAAITGIAQSPATTIPSLLLGLTSVSPFSSAFTLTPKVREDEVDGHRCYVITDSLVKTAVTVTRSFWIDKNTFFLRRSLSNVEGKAQVLVVAGKSYPIPAVKSHIEQQFTNERLNETIPDSVFVVPATQ